MQYRKLVAGAVGVLVAATLVSAQTVYLRNGSFSQCAAPCEGDYPSPTEWGIEGMPSTMGIWRDAIDYHSAPAGLTVMSVGDSGGHFTQRLANLPAAQGGSWTYDFWVKVDSAFGGTFQIVVHFSCHQYWGECPDGGWKTLYLGNAATAGWVHITGSSTVPATAVWGLMRIWNAGGIVTFHVDDIMINGQAEVVSIGEPRLVPAAQSKTGLTTGRSFTVDGRELPGRAQAVADGVRLLETTSGVSKIMASPR